MKNKFSTNVSTETLDGDLRTVEDQRKPRRHFSAPKIVVCPPMEDIKTPVPRASRLLRALGRRMSRSEGSEDSGSSSDSSRAERSSSNSDSGSEDSERARRPRSTVSLRRVFQWLSLTRASSCSPADRAPKKQPQPKRILRPPVSYTYVRGLSGLPTQRVPRRALHR